MPITRITDRVLANTAVTSGVYGGSSTIPVITVDGQGRLTGASNASISLSGNQSFTVVNVTNQLASYGYAFQNIVRLTDGATITMNLAQTNNFIVTLGGNRTLANATNITPGQSGILFVQQDTSGSRTLAFGTGWRFPSNTAPTLTTTANAIDVIAFTAWTSSNLIAQSVLNVG